MYEILVTVCLATASDGSAPVCRDMLVAGHEAQTAEECAEKLPILSKEYDAPRCAPVGEALPVSEVAPGVFVHVGEIAEPEVANRGDVANLGFIIGDESVAVIDTGAARWIGEALWRAIRQKTDKPVSHVILTHLHPDHVLGTHAFDPLDAQVVGHEALPRALADRQTNYLESLASLIGPDFAGTLPPVTDQTVALGKAFDIDLGGRILSLHSWPMAHTGTDLTVLDTKTSTLFVGDLVFDVHAPALDGSLMGWQSVLDQLQDWNVERIVPGHGAPVLDWPAGASAQIRYLETLEHDTRKAIDEGARLGDAVQWIAESEAGFWQLFDAFNPRNATVAFTELEWE